LVLQATICDCLAFDPFAFEEDGLAAPEVDVSRSEIVEAFVPFAPFASPDFTHGTFGQQDIVSAPGVLANDRPAAGDTLTVSAVP
jgi:hypothetical protein